jgi:hypothetical protein
MRVPLPLVVVTAVLVVGCGSSASPTAPTLLQPSGSTAPASAADSAVTTAAVHSAHAVPFTGTLDGTVTTTPLQPPLANVLIAATGNATHLGRFTVEIPHLVNFETATGEGTYTFTAANGDLLTAHFTGTADTSTPIFAIVEHATITGGTGRFEDATGSFTVHRLYDVAAGTTSGTIEGTIALL